jgi:hypothetical protein
MFVESKIDFDFGDASANKAYRKEIICNWNQMVIQIVKGVCGIHDR